MVHVLAAAGVDDGVHDVGGDGQSDAWVPGAYDFDALFPELGLDTVDW